MSAAPRPDHVYEGAEDKLKQLAADCLRNSASVAPSWEQEERDRYAKSAVPVENQLASFQPTAPRTAPHPARHKPGRGANAPGRARVNVELGAATTRNHSRQRRLPRRDDGPYAPPVASEPHRWTGRDCCPHEPRANVDKPSQRARLSGKRSYPERLFSVSETLGSCPRLDQALWIGAFDRGPWRSESCESPSPRNRAPIEKLR